MWDDMGCTAGKHRGYPKVAQVKHCINHGMQNKKFGYPDSFCGRTFIFCDEGKNKSGGEGECSIHPGQFRCKRKEDKKGFWTCCEAEDREAPPCQEGGNCTFALWPDEESKKYFFDRPLKAAHLKYTYALSKERPPSDFQLFGRFCGVFRNPAPYKPVNPGRPNAELTVEEQRAMDNTDRYCLNYGCKKTFK